jgi:hypothetical protein
MAFEALPNIPDVPPTGNWEQDEFTRAVKEYLDKLIGRQVTTDENRVLSEKESQVRHGENFGVTLNLTGANQTMGAASTAILAYDTVSSLDPYLWGFDDNQNIDQVCPEATGVVTIPEDGIYAINTNFTLSKNSLTGSFNLWVFTGFLSRDFTYAAPSGTLTAPWLPLNQWYFSQNATSVESHVMFNGSVISKLLTGDRVATIFQSSSATPLITVGSNNVNNQLNIAKINDYR